MDDVSRRALYDIRQAVSARAVGAAPWFPLSPHLGLLQQVISTLNTVRALTDGQSFTSILQCLSRAEFTPGVIRIRAALTVHSRVPLSVFIGAEIRSVGVRCNETSLHGRDLMEECDVRISERSFNEPDKGDDLKLTILLYAAVRSRRTSSLRISSALTDRETATSVHKLLFKWLGVSMIFCERS